MCDVCVGVCVWVGGWCVVCGCVLVILCVCVYGRAHTPALFSEQNNCHFPTQLQADGSCMKSQCPFRQRQNNLNINVFR